MAKLITVDGQRVTGATIDGQKVVRVSIDGCEIGFQEVFTTGWLRMLGGGMNLTLDLSNMSRVIAAGIRFRGDAPVSTKNINSGWGNPTNTGVVTSTSWKCVRPTFPSAGSKAGCVYSSPKAWGIKVNGQISSANEAEKDPEAMVCISAGFVSGGICGRPNASENFGNTTNYNNATGCVRNSKSGYRVRADVYGYIIYDQTCYSATTKYTINSGYNATRTFQLSQNQILPTSGGAGIIQNPENMSTYYYGIPGPNTVFNVGQTNRIAFSSSAGSGRVYVEVLLVYEE